MFKNRSESSSLLWKILPLAVILVGVMIAATFYLLDDPPEALEMPTNIARVGDPNYQWYSKYVTLESRGIKMAKNIAGRRMVIFSGVVENGGDRILDTVEVKLTLFNAHEPVLEVAKLPIRPGAYTPPIAPLRRRAFTMYLEDLPGNWWASRAEMEIVGFRFLDKSE